MHIKIMAGQLNALDTALEAFGANRLPFLLARKVNRIRREVQEYLEPWTKDIHPLLEEHGQETPQGLSIGPSSPGWDAFCEAVRPYSEKPITLEIQPLQASELEELASRKDFGLDERSYECLRVLGVIQE